ncbi:MAG: response regulator [Burkholderiales bacterium]|nr:response regulator [Burkholderiales bacterium]
MIDTLDAMTSDRPYRRALSYDAAAAEILAGAGTQFDPAAVEAFMAEATTLRAMVAAKCEASPEGLSHAGGVDSDQHAPQLS